MEKKERMEIKVIKHLLTSIEENVEIIRSMLDVVEHKIKPFDFKKFSGDVKKNEKSKS